ncbi:MAG: aminodeoxychorismate lyase [Pseudomonadota bacterium]
MLLASWIDGQPAASLPVDDRGLAYGDGLFETISVRNGRIALLDFHLQRLLRGVEALHLLPIDIDALSLELRRFVSTQADIGCIDFSLKLLLTRGSAGRGYFPLPEAVPRRLLLAYTPAVWPAANGETGIALFECVTRLGVNPALAGIKHLNRLEQVLARAEWDDTAFAEGLLRDVDGRVIEGTMSNLFLVHDGQLVTPRLQRCGIAGVMRSFLVARALTLGIGVLERDVAREELDSADELFVCNSSFGIWPIRALGVRRWTPGPLTRRLQAEVALLWSR